MGKKTDTVRRAIELTGTGQAPLELSKVTTLKTSQQMIHLDRLPDGTWRLIYSGDTIPDITKLQALTIIREDNEQE